MDQEQVWDEIAPWWDKYKISGFGSKDGLIQEFVDDNDVVLDLGCGNGGFVYWLQHMGYKNSYGIDISPEQVEFANRLGIKNIIHAELFEFLRYKESV